MRIDVAVGVIVRDRHVLLAQRAKHKHQGGLWEFPGGKREAGETFFDALCRELDEEVGIFVQSAQPLLDVEHDYEDRQILLSAWVVDDFEGEASGLEGQALQWVAVHTLSAVALPEANKPIVEALLVYLD